MYNVQTNESDDCLKLSFLDHMSRIIFNTRNYPIPHPAPVDDDGLTAGKLREIY